MRSGLCALHRAAEHRHRVGVVEQDRVRAEAFHVAADVEHHRDRAQRAEDAGWPARVADVGVHAVLLGNLDVVPPDADRRGQDGAEDGVGAFERLLAVHGREDGRRIVAFADDALDGAAREIEPLRR